MASPSRRRHSWNFWRASGVDSGSLTLNSRARSSAPDDYEKEQDWSRALHDHPSGPDGLRYRLKHDPSRVGAAIFDRMGKLRARSLGTKIAPEHEKLLAAILKEYGFGLVGGPPLL